jgi:hypothetical protein
MDAVDGGSPLPFDPGLACTDAAALWRADCHPGTVLLVPARAAQAGITTKELLARAAIRSEFITSERRYLALNGEDGVHRVLVEGEDSADKLGALTVLDEHLPLRLHAISRFHAWLAGTAQDKAPCDVPTPYQAARLHRMLRILDALAAAAPRQVSSREIAETIIYHGVSFASPMEWKISSERRHTLRLIAQAVALRDGRYLELLVAHNARRK